MKWLLTLLAAFSISLLSSASMSVLAADKEKEKGKDKENKEEIALDKCPEAVQKTLTNEADGGKIDEIEKVTQGDVVTYEADIIKDKQKIEIVVAVDGKVLSRKVGKTDKDSEDKGKKGKKKEKEQEKEKGQE
jgi:hypothetical protein